MSEQIFDVLVSVSSSPGEPVKVNISEPMDGVKGVIYKIKAGSVDEALDKTATYFDGLVNNFPEEQLLEMLKDFVA